ncbi:tetratricopeptide repeat protein [Alkalisalibacterium limincola]|uniref:Tetratricopeptide repeat protein n=1 Tax=Alkalisalibacterium limincola TaxID=2699169 RepID=A0A5C8KNJ6_9GAMM|nr:tetratricopeptide repeat protein [Alkalisalibacterium limincola]TXK62527.1 tetratricopeptide repeat protein [Alkalisalibacterium limincola]
MPVDGHRVDLAIERARAMMQGAGEASGRILVLTDRADAAAVSAARSARDLGFTVHVLGLGTPEGAPVRAPSGGFTRDTSDRLTMARLEPASLERLAAAGGGRFAALRADDADLDALGVLEVGAVRTDDAGRLGAQRRDEGFWLVLLMLPLLLPEFRRGGVMALAALLLLAPATPAVATDLAAVFKRDDQRAWEALAEGEAELALSLARDPALRGAAAYRLGDFEAAIEAFGEAGGLDGAYNLGNALAGAGRYQEALDAWRGVLERDPGHEDARSNLEALEQWLQQQPRPPEHDETAAGEEDPEASRAPGDGEEDAAAQDPGTGERADTAEDAGSDQPDEGQPSGEPGDEGDGEAAGGPPEPGDPDEQAAAEQAVRDAIEQALQEREEQEASAAAAAEAPDPEALAEREEAEAIERWLRLVDDDPGALLRRKFMMEHQRRQRGGGE